MWKSKSHAANGVLVRFKRIFLSSSSGLSRRKISYSPPPPLSSPSQREGEEFPIFSPLPFGKGGD